MEYKLIEITSEFFSKFTSEIVFRILFYFTYNENTYENILIKLQFSRGVVAASCLMFCYPVYSAYNWTQI